MKIQNAFSSTSRRQVTPKGEAGYDNARENIDPYIKTKVIDTKELYVDGTPVAGGGDVTAAVALTDETLVQGDGGAKGVKTSTATVAQVAAAVAHYGDNTKTHSDYLKNDAADAGVGLTLSADNTTADLAYVPMVLYNTDATPPAANTVPIGTLYIQYTP